jgi:hypothetical protein
MESNTYYSIEELTLLCKKDNIFLEKCKFNTDFKMVKYNESTCQSPALIKYRGAIFNEINNELIIQFPLLIDLSIHKDKINTLIDNIQQSSGEINIHQLLDGSLIRLAYIQNNGWIISTNRKEDARDAYWMNDISYFNQFMEGLIGKINNDVDDNEVEYEMFTENLNKDYIYFFSVCHPKNIIVVHYKTPKIYHLTSINKNSYKEEFIDVLYKNTIIQKPNKFSISKEEIVLMLKNDTLDDKFYPGFIIQIQNQYNYIDRYRYQHHKYTNARLLRGNDPVIAITCIKNIQNDTIKDFIQFYPMYYNDAIFITDEIKKITRLINFLYIEIYKKSQKDKFESLGTNTKYLLKKIHTDLFIKDKILNIKPYINFQKINDYLKNTSPQLMLKVMFENK